MVARANAHIRYPARFQLVAAMNPCRCGLGGAGRGACGKAPRCQRDYQNRISGPMFDRIDLTVETPPVTAADMALPPPAEGTAEARARVAVARAMQEDRARAAGLDPSQGLNARASGDTLDRFATPDEAGRMLLMRGRRSGRSDGARLDPHAAASAHHRRSGRGWGRAAPPHRRSPDLSPQHRGRRS